MILIGPNRSPCVRRAAIVLSAYGMACEQQPLSGSDDRAKVRAFDPPGRISPLARDDGTPSPAQRRRAGEPAFTVTEHPR